MPVPLSGYNTLATIGNTPVALTEWEVMPEVDDIDATNTESGGYHVAFPGPVKCEITLTGYVDAYNNPFSTGGLITSLPEQFVPSGTISLQIYVAAQPGGSPAGPYWNFSSQTVGNLQGYGAWVQSCQMKASVKEKVMFTAKLIGSGVFSYPIGDVL